jgi:DNA-binding NtrC family response regulator
MGCGLRSAALVSSLSAKLPPDDVIFGRSSAREAVRLSAEMAATTHVPVLLQGQSGTEVSARSKVVSKDEEEA